MSGRTLLLGCGYTLTRTAESLGSERCVLTTTRPEKAEALVARGYSARVISISRSDDLQGIFGEFPDIDTIVDGVPPLDGDADPAGGARAVCRAVRGTNVRRIVYLSTTGVFGIEDGSQVDESTPAAPRNPRAEARLRSELAYRECGLEVSVLRVPAIYGPGRGIGNALKRGSYRLIEHGERWTNRIHVADLSEIIRRLVTNFPDASLPALLCVSDGNFAQACEVVRFYRERFGFAEPLSISLAEATSRGHYTQLANQRVSNELVRRTVMETFLYPSFREGAATEFEQADDLPRRP